MALEKEIETYRRELPNLLGNEGKFVVVENDKISRSAEHTDVQQEH